MSVSVITFSAHPALHAGFVRTSTLSTYTLGRTDQLPHPRFRDGNVRRFYETRVAGVLSMPHMRACNRLAWGVGQSR